MLCTMTPSLLLLGNLVHLVTESSMLRSRKDFHQTIRAEGRLAHINAVVYNTPRTSKLKQDHLILDYIDAIMFSMYSGITVYYHLSFKVYHLLSHHGGTNYYVLLAFTKISLQL